MSYARSWDTLVLTRRRLIAAVGAYGVAASAGGRSAAAAQKAPLRQILTSGLQSSTMAAFDVDQLTTIMLTMPLEAPVQAIRIGLANNRPDPYALGGVCCCEAENFRPQAGTQWSYFTFGRATPGAGAAGGAPQPITVPGNQVAVTGAADVPGILWSDWMSLRTRSPGRPQMLFRMLVPPQALPMTLVGFPRDVEQAIPGLPSRVIQARQTPGDFVTTPGAAITTLGVAQFTPLFAVQVQSLSPGVQMVIGGDSQCAAWHTFARQAAMRLSTPSRPIAVWDVATGKSSRTFWPTEDMAIEAAHPSICVFPGWTANDGETAPAYERFLPRVRETVQLVRREGGIPIVLKGTPRKLFGTPALAGWQQWNAALPGLVPGVTMFDVNQAAADPEQPGNWRPDFTVDHIHSNMAGNAAIAAAFAPVLQSLL